MKQGTCKHFTGYQNGKCMAGIEYRALVGGDDFGWAARLPCVTNSPLNKPGGPPCEKFEEPTAEELAADKAATRKRMDGFVEALRRIKAANKGRGEAGVVTCPECKGQLHFSIAKLNGHIWGKCETPDCLAWMM